MLFCYISLSLQVEASAVKKRKAHVIDVKRVQNGGISLARIKMPFGEIRKK